MFIKNIHIENFKSLKNFDFEPRPLILLFGKNASGKSTLINALMFLNKNLIPLSSNYKNYSGGQLNYQLSDDVDLISYEKVVTDGDTENNIIFDLQLDFDYFFPSDINDYSDSFSFGDGEINNHPNHNQNRCNIRLHIEFNKSDEKEYLNCVSIEDLCSSMLLRYDINEKGSVNISYKGDYKVLFYLKDIELNIKADNENDLKSINHNLSFHSMPFHSNDSTLYVDKLNEIKKIFENSKDPKYSQFSETELLEGIKIYYLYYYLIPSLIAAYLNTMHLPHIRQNPQKYYILESNKFKQCDYYGFLNTLCTHQNYLIKYLGQKDLSTSKSKLLFYKRLQDIIRIEHRYGRKRIHDYLQVLEKKQKKPDELYEEYKSNTNNKSKPYFSRKDMNIIYDLHKGHIMGYTGDYLVSAGDDTYPEFLKNAYININSILKKLEIDGYLFVEKDEKIGELSIIKENGKSFNLVNESSGLLQILPVLLGLVKLKEMVFDVSEKNILKYTHSMDYQNVIANSLNYFNGLFIEQPELHLHPGLQTKVIEVIVEYLKDFEIYNSVIIETHSEHILRKLQLEVAKGNIDKDSIGINFVTKREKQTVCEIIDINNKGLLKKEFPDGFFDDTFELSVELFKIN